ncbi:MAG: purine-nucleoside phosphorylase [Deltaproteobacteria bacterium]|nr:purine-nucleoside phosphorylase [Deltaproteobacteria bacterium]
MANEGDRCGAEAVARAADFVRPRIAGLEPPCLGIVLGSGLGPLAGEVEAPVILSAAEVPDAPRSTVAGHEGRLVFGRLNGVSVAMLQGRVHLYEGYSPSEVVFLVRVLVQLGVSDLLITNAAGGIDTKFSVPDLMLIRDHLNLTGLNPLVGPNVPSFGVRFPDMTEAYDSALAERMLTAAQAQRLHLREGVYAGVLGPSYETPAEIRMLRALGAQAVGMSTVHEVIAARHMGARVLGLSCISNMAAGISGEPLTHEEVTAAGARVQADLTNLVKAFVGSFRETR